MFNYLLAKATGGQFILRIEDTDQSRLVPGAAERLLQKLEACGIVPDEGPSFGGSGGGDMGPHAPYTQSQRLERYHEAVDKLIESGHAYRCFCSSERLEALRAAQARRGDAVMYDRACAALDPDEAAERAAAGEPHVVRLRVDPFGATDVQDALLGSIRFPHDAVDDTVLLKSDGFPTYHLACVVDDVAMGITHVIRGREWLPSTPKHAILLHALGADRPTWIHLPLLLGPDGSKLSKRHGHASVEAFLDAGFLPAALTNFVALLGWHPGGEQDTEVLTMPELCAAFSVEGLNKSNAVVDRTKLEWFNGQHIRRLLASDQPADAPDRAELLNGAVSAIGHLLAAETARAVAAEAQAEAEAEPVTAVTALDCPGDGCDPPVVVTGTDQFNPGFLERAVMVQHEQAKYPADLGRLALPFLRPPPLDKVDPETWDAVDPAVALPILEQVLLPLWRQLDDWAGAVKAIQQACKPAAREGLGIDLKGKLKPGLVMVPVRVAVTGARAGAPLGGVLGAVGQRAAIDRVERFVAALRSRQPQDA